jgi:hypothetical protein
MSEGHWEGYVSGREALFSNPVLNSMIAQTWVVTRSVPGGLHNINCMLDEDTGEWLCHKHCTVTNPPS